MTDFDEIIERRGTSSEKWDRYRGVDIIPLWVADMDFRSPPAVIEALHRRVDHGIFGYTLPPDDLVDAVADSLREEFDWTIERDWIIWLPGLVSGLNIACRSVGDNGDDVLTAIPVYPPFLSAPRHSLRNLVTTSLAERSGNWGFDFEQLKQAITGRTRLFILCNPHNPVGRVYSREELLALAEICERHKLFICSDEIHAGLVLDEDKKHIPLATLSPETACRTITLMAPSKTYNIPGLGCAFAVIPDPGLRRHFQEAMKGIVPPVNTLGYAAALAAYRESRDWRRALIAYLRNNREIVKDAVSGMPGLSMSHVEATYLAWIDTRKTGIEAPVGFFERAGVGLSNGEEFGRQGFVRLNFGCPRPVLQEALDRMAKALESR